MTRKDYLLIAEAVANTRVIQNADTETLDVLSENLAALLARDNDFFDTGRFLQACGVES